MRSKKLIVANWKMNPAALPDAKKLFAKTREIALANRKRVSVVVCPPALYLDSLRRSMPVYKDFYIGSQDAFYEPVGSHTGETSAVMVRQFGIKYAIIGHSERRAKGETDESVGKKVIAVLKEGITPIVCIGEPTRDKEGEYLDFLTKQLRTALSGAATADLKKIIIAYEPLYAVGRRESEAASPRDIFEIVILIRKFAADTFGKPAADDLTVLYGGSVGESNATGILTDAGVDGLLVGRESLVPTEFSKIVSLANIL